MQVFWHYTGKMLKNWYFQLAENEKIGLKFENWLPWQRRYF